MIKDAGELALTRLESIYNNIFGAYNNPFYHLGALTVFFLWVVLVSGIYVFIFFETSVYRAYESVEYMTHEQWYIGGVMRSLHRYASDAAVMTMMLHMAREFIKGRYNGSRWFSWFTGVPLLWMIFPLGITGYWLVWDELALYVAIASSELMDWLPIFTDPMARNFLTPDSLSDRFFTLLAFIHIIGLPVFLLFGIWIHVLRISRANVNPPRALVIGSMLMLLALSLIKPALSHTEADLTVVPGELAIDWFYLQIYPLMDVLSYAQVWSVLFGGSLFLSVLPWLYRPRRDPVAAVDLPNCNGCGRCEDDCPFIAVTMQARSDSLPYEQEAVVNADLCTSCGICAGACPTSTPYRRRSELVPGIDLPGFPVSSLREQTLAITNALDGSSRVLVYGCQHGPDLKKVRQTGVGVIEIPCIAMLPPSFIDFVISRSHADGVMLTGCCEGECYQRLGISWVEQRLAGKRDPYLRKRVSLERVSTCWSGSSGNKQLMKELGVFREHLKKLQPVRHTIHNHHAGDGA